MAGLGVRSSADRAHEPPPVERKDRREQADDTEHDQDDALLPVIGAVRKTYARTGQDKDATHPPCRWMLADGFVEALVASGSCDAKIKRG